MFAFYPYLLPKGYTAHFARMRRWFMPCFFIFLFSIKGVAQNGNSYDEVAALFTVPRIGTTEIIVLIKEEKAWLPVKEVFDFLKIKNTPSDGLDSLSGFFIDPKVAYLIDKPKNLVRFEEKIISLPPSALVQTETGLFLKTEVFCQIFGLDCQFNFRTLSFTLKTNIELPALREMQQEQLRKNLSQLKGEKKADTTMKRNFRLFHLGMADWSVVATQQTQMKNYIRANASFGAILAGGETDLRLNVYSDQSFSSRQQFYRWRYVNNDLSLFKQVSIGRISTQSVSSIFAPVNGIQITNTPTTYRKSFGTYRYTGNTEPEWIVELYVNNVLVNYVKADASGFFAFDIPIVYGSSAIRLKFYGPWGEENSKEEHITVPFNFVPVGRLEYSVSAGLVDDRTSSYFSRGGLSYGLSRRITLGAGAEYLSSVMAGKPMPFLNASVRLGGGLILNGEYTHGVKAKTTLNYRLPSNVQLDLSYSKYDPNQTAIWYNYLEERKATVSLPIRLKKIYAFSRLTFNQYILAKNQYSNAELLMSTAVAGVSASFRTFARFSGQTKPDVYSDLFLSCRLPFGIRFSPLVQFRVSEKYFSMIKGEAEKRVSDKGVLSLAYEKNWLMHGSSFVLGLRYDLSFARTFLSVRRGYRTTTATQSASGSFIYESKAGYAQLGNQSVVGKGGFVVMPFLDLNCNGKREADEPRVPGLKLRVSGGRIEERNDGSLLITGLEAYTSYLIELDKNSFDNIAWQIKRATIRATVEPNRLSMIEVPVAVVGEASGMVYLQKGTTQKGLSRIVVNFYDSTHGLVAKTLTEGDGYFSFLGLVPGRYTVKMDSAQMRQLKMAFTPDSLSFTIAGSEEGTVADGFEFVLRSLSGPDEPAPPRHPASGIEKKKADSGELDFSPKDTLASLSREWHKKGTGTLKTTDAPSPGLYPDTASQPSRAPVSGASPFWSVPVDSVIILRVNTPDGKSAVQQMQPPEDRTRQQSGTLSKNVFPAHKETSASAAQKVASLKIPSPTRAGQGRTQAKGPAAQASSGAGSVQRVDTAAIEAVSASGRAPAHGQRLSPAKRPAAFGAGVPLQRTQRGRPSPMVKQLPPAPKGQPVSKGSKQPAAPAKSPRPPATQKTQTPTGAGSILVPRPQPEPGSYWQPASLRLLLLADYHRLDKQHRQLSEKLRALRREQEELLQQQRALTREIRRLRQRIGEKQSAAGK